jgi:UPF0755 protein
MNKFPYTILGIFIIFILIGLFLPKSFNCEIVEIDIEKGQGLEETSISLKDNNIIWSKNFLSAYVFILNKSTDVKAGHYNLKTCDNIYQIANKITSSQFPDQKFTIIPGWTNRKIARELVDNGFIEHEIEFLDKAERLEGYLYPDTYFLHDTNSIDELIQKAQENYNSKVKDLSYENLILASIIEKELQTLEDKKIGAGVLFNRLSIGMPLQVDATLTYILGKGSLDLSKDDLDFDSPYNTYKHRELPPGPICNPSLDSINAVLEPVESDYLYYLTTPEGETIFSETLEEHRKAKYEHLF